MCVCKSIAPGMTILSVQSIIESIFPLIFSFEVIIPSVTNISLTGTDYAIGEVLSVSDTDVGGGGGSGFQYTVSNVGFVSAVSVTEPGQAYELSDTLILGLGYRFSLKKGLMGAL